MLLDKSSAIHNFAAYLCECLCFFLQNQVYKPSLAIMRSHWSQSISVCQQRQTNKTVNGALFFLQTFKNYQIFLPHPSTLESQIAPNRNSSAFLLHTSKTFSNVEWLSIFSQTFLELIFATKIKTMLLKQSAVLFTSCQKNIAYIMCLNT